ncbi:DUF4328 domain-containing protein [Flavobacterium caeni]|uniref:DUF4328 domain-containing protein n=1 Tax=Flavobacterium caeni TaxID=490189 RepID=A0A1G5HU65_9FLAO|nr:DUF4328 domain-containing protein [Flavobacterium caeni]SCY67303.1 protein of unknown function [Flavobacterium caeni]
MKPLKPNQQRAQLTIVLLWIVLALYALLAISSYFEYRLLQSWQDGATVSMEAAEANDARQQLLVIVMVIAYIATIVAFISWFRRAYYNLHQRVSGLSQTEGWAAGAWFVPFVNLYMPYQIMKELYTETFEIMGSKKGEYPEHFTASYVGWWWAGWIVCMLYGRVEWALTKSAESLPESITAALMGAIGCVLMVPLALLAIKVVADYAKMESMLFAQETTAVQKTADNTGEKTVETVPEPFS